jgi:hypothetical protein
MIPVDALRGVTRDGLLQLLKAPIAGAGRPEDGVVELMGGRVKPYAAPSDWRDARVADIAFSVEGRSLTTPALCVDFVGLPEV